MRENWRYKCCKTVRSGTEKLAIESERAPVALSRPATRPFRVSARHTGTDRWLSPELAAADQLLIDEALVPTVESTTGLLS